MLLAAHTCYDRYFFLSQIYDLHARFIENISGVFVPFQAIITSGTRFVENISGVFPHLERRIYTFSIYHTSE